MDCMCVSKLVIKLTLLYMCVWALSPKKPQWIKTFKQCDDETFFDSLVPPSSTLTHMPTGRSSLSQTSCPSLSTAHIFSIYNFLVFLKYHMWEIEIVCFIVNVVGGRLNLLNYWSFWVSNGLLIIVVEDSQRSDFRVLIGGPMLIW